MDAARGDPERVERLAELTPRVMAGLMGAADGLAAAGYDVAAEVDAAVERIRDTHPMDWHYGEKMGAWTIDCDCGEFRAPDGTGFGKEWRKK